MPKTRLASKAERLAQKAEDISGIGTFNLRRVRDAVAEGRFNLYAIDRIEDQTLVGAEARTAISVLRVAVVAFLAEIHDAVPADLDSANTRTTVSLKSVAVVASFTRIHDAITADLDSAKP